MEINKVKGANYKNKNHTLYARYVRNWLQLFNSKYKMINYNICDF